MARSNFPMMGNIPNINQQGNLYNQFQQIPINIPPQQQIGLYPNMMNGIY